MQDIFILRHGHAENLETNGAKTDFDRALTKEGIEKIKRLSLYLNKLKEEINLVLTSPLKRAHETAELLISSLLSKPELKIVDFLSSGVSTKEIAKGLLPYSSYNKVVLVGHAPDLEMFLGKLIGASRIKLKKGALAKVILNNNIELAGELEWLIIPKLIKKIKVET